MPLGLLYAAYAFIITVSNPSYGQCPVRELLPNNGQDCWNFGTSLAVAANQVIVGAPLNFCAATNTSVERGPSQGLHGYATVHEGPNWNEVQRLNAFLPDDFDRFGNRLDAHGNVLAVIALESPNAIYVFRNDGVHWIEEQRLDPPSDITNWDSVAVADNLIAVGANGVVHVYRFDGSLWNFEQSLFPSDGPPEVNLGYSLATDGDRIAVGSMTSTGQVEFSGAAYIFVHTQGGWVEEQKIWAVENNGGALFGYSLSISEDLTVVGAPTWDMESPGACYVFRFDGQAWQQEEKLVAPDPQSGDGFGMAVTHQNQTILVGSSNECAHTFDFDGAQWRFGSRFISTDTPFGEGFGESVAMNNNHVFIGASGADDNGPDSGKVYMFDLLEPGPNQPSVGDPYLKSRYTSVSGLSGQSTAIRYRISSIHHPDPPYAGGPATDFSSFEGQVRWVGPPVQYVESTSNPTPFWSAVLQCEPHYMDWSSIGVLHVAGREIVPSSTYEVQIVAEGCELDQESNFSLALTMLTSRWGDVEEPFNPSNQSVQPDISDVSALVNKFRGAPGSPIKARSLLAGDPPDPTLDLGFDHISACLDAFRGRPYPYAGPTPCP